MTTAPQSELHGDLREPGPPPAAEEILIPPRRRSWAWLGIAGWVAAAVLTVAVGTFWETIVRLRHEIRMRDERVAELDARVARDQRWLTLVSAPGARITGLRPVAAGSSALLGRVVYDPASHRALVVFQGAFPPPGRDYQLWAVRGGTPLDLGVLRPDSVGVAIYRLENMGTPGVTEAFTVSLEPKGGSPSAGGPTGAVVLEGPLEG